MKILKKPVELKLIRQSAKVILSYYALCYFQYFLQSILELLLILFITNTEIIIKKIFLYMIMFIKEKINNNNIKWEE